MSFLGDLADRIRKTFNRKNTPKLDNATYRGNNYNRDLILESNLNKHNMKYFENPWKYNEFCKEYFKEPGNFESQYDYVDIISQMQANGAMDEFKSYLSYIQNNSNLYYPSAVHGIDHTSRVTFLAEMLCSLDNLSSHDKNLIMVAAELHDIGREDDKKRFDHGFAGKEKIEKYGLLRNFSSKDKNIIEFAVASHSLEPEQIEEQLKKVPKRHRTEYKRVLDYLQDADKLDRARINYEKNIGAGVDPNRLANPTAKRLLKVAHQNFYEFYNVMNYENEISKTDQLGISMKSYFDEVRSYGYNISFEDFQNIVAELQPGTLQKLKSEGNLNKIFSYSNFLANRVPETFDDRIKVNRVEPDKLFDEINKDKSTPIIKDVFDEDYMTYYNLKKNDPEAFNLLCYVDVDVATRDIIGLAKVVQIEDLAKFHSSGWQFRMNDIFRLGSKITPEQYQTIINNGKFEDLVSSKYVKPEIVNGVRANLANQGINFTDDYFNNYYGLIEQIASIQPDIFKIPNIQNYTISEVFLAATKLDDAKNRIIDGKNGEFIFDSKTILDLIDYNKQVKDNTRNLSEREQLDFVTDFAKANLIDRNPRCIEYINKKNKPYMASSIDEMIDYKEFCADKILLDRDIDLKTAKRNFINAMFDIDVPATYQRQFEKEAENRIYFYEKYLPNSEINQNSGNLIHVISDLNNAKTIDKFKNILFTNKKMINSYNTEYIGHQMENELTDYSRDDFASNLQKTANEIRNKSYTKVSTPDGKNKVDVKVLDGEKFYFANFTAMPKCSAKANRILKDNKTNQQEKLYDEMLNTSINPEQICTSIISSEMLAHAASILPDQELSYAIVPENKNKISIAATHDLSTAKRGGTIRTTNKTTTPRSIDDFTAGTTEEHSEVVMDGYPDFIICYDKVTDIAIEKQKKMQQEYNEKGIDKKLDIVLIKSKDKYLPEIKINVMAEHAEIKNKLATNSLNLKDFHKMFERPESNFVLRTLQSIHSSSYRDDVWDEKYNRNALNSMTDILDSISQIIKPEYGRAVLNQVDILLERADTSKPGYGKNFYDHNYAREIDSKRLKQIQNRLELKVKPYEKNVEVSEINNNLKETNLRNSGTTR